MAYKPQLEGPCSFSPFWRVNILSLVLGAYTFLHLQIPLPPASCLLGTAPEWHQPSGFGSHSVLLGLVAIILAR